MTQRTVKDARAWLELNAIGLNPVAYAQYEQELREVEARWHHEAMQVVTGEATSFSGDHRELLTDGCGIRDDYEQLAKDAATGRLSAKEYQERLDALNSEGGAFNQRMARLAKKIEMVEAIEADPVAYTDALFDRNPPLSKPEFSF
jgi:chromosome segregation ATPase